MEMITNKSFLTKCPRCKGAMSYDKFYGSGEQFWGQRCLICGMIIDPIILQNQQWMRDGRGIYPMRARKR